MDGSKSGEEEDRNRVDIRFFPVRMSGCFVFRRRNKEEPQNFITAVIKIFTSFVLLALLTLFEIVHIMFKMNLEIAVAFCNSLAFPARHVDDLWPPHSRNHYAR